MSAVDPGNAPEGLQATLVPRNDLDALRGSYAVAEGGFRPRSADELAAARAARAAKRLGWSKLGLRQQWADEAWMRAHLATAGVRAPDSGEPATANRLRLLLRRAGVGNDEARTAVGVDMDEYLSLNPGLPLWAAVALVLEATGRFTPERGGCMTAADPRTAAANLAMGDRLSRTYAGNLAAQKAMWQIAQRQGGQEIVDAARASLGDDEVALAAFGRSLARGREVQS